MKLIPLTQGMFAQVDDEDYDELVKFRWFARKHNKTFYAARNLKKGQKFVTFHMHKELLGEIEGKEIDHIDGDGLNNRKENLRFVTHRQNLQNRRDTKSIHQPGVWLKRSPDKWQAMIRINGIRRYLGTFPTEKLASDAYNLALQNIGEFRVSQQ